MEHTTDRLFWTLTSIIVAALVMTLGAKAFPKATSAITNQLQGTVYSSDISSGIKKPINFAGDGTDDYSWLPTGGSSSSNTPVVTNNTDGTTALNRVTELNDKVFQQQQELRHYQDSLRDAVTHINDLNSRLNQVQQNASSAEKVDDLQQQIIDANSQMKNYQFQMDKLNKDLSANKDKLEEAQQQVQDMVAKAAANNDSLVEQLQKQGAQISQQNLTLAAYQSQAQQNSHELANLKDQLVQYKKSGDVNAQTVVDLQNQIKQLSNAQTLASDQATKAIADAINKINDQSSRIDDQDSKINGQNARQDTIQQLINTIQAQQGNDGSLITSLTQQLNDLKNQQQQNQYVKYIRNLNRGDDLNFVREQGVYGLNDANENGIPANAPSFMIANGNQSNGQLIVNHTNTPNGDTYFQTIYYTQDKNNQPGIAFRSFRNSAWSDWTRVADLKDLPVQKQPRILTSNDDINDINEPGVYAVANDHPKNSPNDNNEWSILVVNQTGMGVKGMIWYDYTGDMYFHYFDMNPHPWTKVATSDDMVHIENEIQNAAATAATNTFNNNMYHLPASGDLNHSYSNSYFWPNTANKPDFGDNNANGPVLYAGTDGNGVQYAFQANGNGHGFAWRSQVQGYWGAWQYSTNQNDIANLQNEINDLRNQLNNALVVRNDLRTYGNDFNTFTNTGIYPMVDAWAGDWVNGPHYDAPNGPSYGRSGGVQLEVTNVHGRITQTVTATNGIWQRTRITNTWGDWFKVDAPNALQYQGELDSSKSFNDYKDMGIYSLSGKQIPRDAPDSNAIGTLEVIKANGTIVQKWYSFENSGGMGKGWTVREYMRDQENYQTWWNSWVEVGNTTEIQNAQNSADNANNSANNAQNTANDANNKASDAQNKANDANNKANDAQNSANNANNTANDARNRANSSMSIGQTLGANTRIKTVRTSGVYNLDGSWYLGLPGNRDGFLRGQLVVYDGGGTTTQLLYLEDGHVYHRNVNGNDATKWTLS